MNIRVALITGGTGFIGSKLIQLLLDNGWAVHVVVRPISDTSMLGEEQQALTFHCYDGTMASILEIVQKAKPQVVFHLASLFLSSHRSEDVESLIYSNLLFGTQLVEAMSIEGVSCLVNTGTSWQHYGGEDYNPVNLYAATKKAFEDLLHYYVEAHDLRIVTLMLFDTYGLDDPRSKLITLLHRVVETRRPLIMTQGEQQLDLVHVDDVARSFVVAAKSLLQGVVSSHARYAVSSGEVLTPRDLVAEIEAITGQTLPIVWGGRPYRSREVMHLWQGPILPGWQPRIPIQIGLRQLFSNDRSSS